MIPFFKKRVTIFTSYAQQFLNKIYFIYSYCKNLIDIRLQILK